jgi:hypothetical protein
LEIHTNFYPLGQSQVAVKQNQFLLVCHLAYTQTAEVFPIQWSTWPEFGLINYKPKLNSSLNEALMHFTGLNTRQFLFCFVPYFQAQAPEFNGVNLYKHSFSKDVAINIYAVLANMFPNWAKRRVLIEKIKS